MAPPEMRTGHFVMVKDLVSRGDLNLRVARVLDKSWTEVAQHPGRVPVEMVVGKESMWVKLDNLAGPILDPADMTAPPYNAMTPEERTEATLRMLKPQKPAPTPTPAAEPEPEPEPEPKPQDPLRNLGRDWTQRRCESAALFVTYLPPKGCMPEKTLGLPQPAGPYGKGTLSLWKYNLDPYTADLVWIPDREETPRWHAVRLDLVDLRCVGLSRRDEDTICMSFTNEHGPDCTYYWFTFNEGKAVYFLNTLRKLNVSRAPMPPKPAPATRAPQPKSIEAPAPAPAPDRRAAERATLRNVIQENDPRPHYCIYCGSEGLYGDKCLPCGFYRGSHCFGPNGPLQKGDTLMGRKLTYVKWPWQGDPEAPYVRAGVAASADVAPEPKPKYAVDPPPVRAMTRDEVLGPNPCAEVCPKYPNCTAARLVAYVLGKVDHVTPGVKSDFRYYLTDTEAWCRVRAEIIEIHEAGEENAAEVLHEEYLVAHHTLCQTETRPAYLPADWDAMKRRVKARHKKDKGAEDPEALAYPASDADEDEVAAYLEAKVRQLDADAAAQPVRAPAPTNPKPERKGDPWGVAAFFEQLLKELPYYHREEMAEILKGETIKDFEVGEVIDGRNSYERSLTVSLTKTPCEDSDDESEGDESEGDDDANQASVPAERTTTTITLNTYITPYDDNNAGVWLVDDTGYERELASVGTIPCDGGVPVHRRNQASAARCARFVIEYLVHGWAPWEGD